MENIFSDERESGFSEKDLKYLSREAFEKLKRELEYLRTDFRQEIANRLEYAKSLGDLSENSEYTEAKDMQENNETRIAEIEDILSRSVLIAKTASAPSVEIGSTVIAKRKGSEYPEQFIVVGSEEANPIERKISNESPLGRAFLGRKKGDMVHAHTPSGLSEYTIVDIA